MSIPRSLLDECVEEMKGLIQEFIEDLNELKKKWELRRNEM